MLQLPRRSGQYAASPASRGSQKEEKPRLATAPGSVEEQARWRTGRRGEESAERRGEYSVVLRPVELPDWKAEEDRADVVVPLEVAVADFDTALRDHRNKRRGRTAGTVMTSSPRAQESQVIDDHLFGTETNAIGATADSVNEENNPSTWFDGTEATWAVVTLVGGGTPTQPALRWTRDAEGDENANGGKETPRIEPGRKLISFDLPQPPSGPESVGNTITAAEGMVVDVVEDRPETMSAANTTLEGDATNEKSDREDEKHCQYTHLSEQPGSLQSSLRVHDMPEESNANVTKTPSAGTPSPQPVPAADPSIASATVDAVISESTAYEHAMTSKKVVETYIFPVVTDAMKSTDPLSTEEQRVAGTWMAGSMSSPPANDIPVPQPPSPLTVAKAEAELEEKILALQSKRDAFEREEKATLDQNRSERLGREQAKRANEFADEDRQLLAGEELRLAEIRRQADLGRLQRSAEFEETDAVLVGFGAVKPPRQTRAQGGHVLVGKQHVGQSLELDRSKVEGDAPNKITPSDSSAITSTSQPALALEALEIEESEELKHVKVPVRGMRPQHYTEADILPKGVKRVVAHQPAENILDNMESLAARAQVAGHGANIEEFEQVCQYLPVLIYKVPSLHDPGVRCWVRRIYPMG